MTETEEQANDFSHYYNSLTDDQKVMKQSQEISTNKPHLFPLFIFSIGSFYIEYRGILCTSIYIILIESIVSDTG